MQTPEQLATAGASRNQREKERDEQELIRVAEMEKAVKKAQVLKLSSRFVNLIIICHILYLIIGPQLEKVL